MEPLTRSAPPEPEATAEELLRWVVEQSRLSVDEGIGLGGLAALVTEQEPWFTELMRSLLMRHRQMLAEAIRRHCDDGTVCADLDVETFLDCVVGAYFAEQARRGEVDEDWPARITRTLLPTFAA